MIFQSPARESSPITSELAPLASGLVIKPNSTKAVAALRSVTTAATAAIASRPANGKWVHSSARSRTRLFPNFVKRASRQEPCREMKGGRNSEGALQRTPHGFSLQEIYYQK